MECHGMGVWINWPGCAGQANKWEAALARKSKPVGNGTSEANTIDLQGLPRRRQALAAVANTQAPTVPAALVRQEAGGRGIRRPGAVGPEASHAGRLQFEMAAQAIELL